MDRYFVVQGTRGLTGMNALQHGMAKIPAVEPSATLAASGCRREIGRWDCGPRLSANAGLNVRQR